MDKARKILVMSYSDGSGTPSVCPFILSPREVEIAEWIIGHAGETEIVLRTIESGEDIHQPTIRDNTMEWVYSVGSDSND